MNKFEYLIIAILGQILFQFINKVYTFNENYLQFLQVFFALILIFIYRAIKQIIFKKDIELSKINDQEIQDCLKKWEPYNKKRENFQNYDEYLNKQLMHNYVEQKGNVCGSTSVVCCVNYLLNLQKRNQSRLKTSDAHEIYYYVFEQKLEKQQKNLKKYANDSYQYLINLADKELIDLYSKKESFKKLANQKIQQNQNLQNLQEESLQRDIIIEHFRSYCQAKYNLNRIFNGEKCSTWPVGNDLITLCAKTVASIKDQNLRVQKFMGNQLSTIILSSKDTQEQIEEQWLQLIDEIKKQDQVFLYHLDNHYTVIYGYRQFEYKNTIFRQILTSRHGQRPKSWVDFQYDWETFSEKKNKIIKKRSVRSCLIKWHGYKILKMQIASKYVDKDIGEIQNLVQKYRQKNQFINNDITEREGSDGNDDKSDIEA